MLQEKIDKLSACIKELGLKKSEQDSILAFLDASAKRSDDTHVNNQLSLIFFKILVRHPSILLSKKSDLLLQFLLHEMKRRVVSLSHAGPRKGK